MGKSKSFKRIFYLLVVTLIIAVSYTFVQKVYIRTAYYEKVVDGMSSFLQQQQRMCIDFSTYNK